MIELTPQNLYQMQAAKSTTATVSLVVATTTGQPINIIATHISTLFGPALCACEEEGGGGGGGGAPPHRGAGGGGEGGGG